MKSRRLVYRVFLKILALCGLLALLWVLFNSLFYSDNTNTAQVDTKKTMIVKLSLSGMRRNEIRKVHLGNKEVAVLYRNDSFSYQDKDSSYPKFLELDSRSLKKDYFVYYNYGDSLNCPLFYSKDTFKDVCTGNKFDSSGKGKNEIKHGFKIEVPPHYFLGSDLFLGAWEK